MITTAKLFCDGWEFCETSLGASYGDVMSSDVFRPVEIPHDYMIYDTHALYRTGEGWYRRVYTYAPTEDRTILRFEGVYMDSTVFVNGEAVFEWKYGYTTFEVDVTDHLHEGENVITVRCVYRDPNTRWYSGAGIYRCVWLKTAPVTRIASDGVYISYARLDGGSWRVTVRTELCGCEHGTLTHKIVDRDGNAIASVESSVDGNICECGMDVESPHLWDIGDTYMYTLSTVLTVGGSIIDAAENSFGFRKIEFRADSGFYLNGRHVKLHGVCEHHDCGALGTAVNKAALRRKLEKLASMGVNSIRTSHNPPAVELLELCDELGFLIIDESFDMWEYPKTQHDYGVYFREWHERDVASWIRRDRNHPCIIMWSIGNEIGDTTSPRGIEVTEELCRLVRVHDPYKNAFTTSGSNHMRNENAQKCGLLLDVVGYNYAESLYDAHHEKYPTYCIYGSETASTVQSRGIYHYPYSSKFLTHDDHQCSSMFNCTTSWASKSTEYNITEDRRARYCAGQYIWTGFDYIGEPTPYETKNSYFGQIDTAGFSKDSYYAYRAEWTDGAVTPFVRISPECWDYNEGEMIDVTVHSNASRSELYFNSSLVGTFDHDHESGMKISEFWQIPYAPGALTAVAYDKDGNIVARDEVRSFSDPTSIVLEPERGSINADGRDLLFVAISTVDENGTFVANARNRMNVAVTGAGRLVGLDNGDSTDYEQYKSSSRRLFSGRLMAIVAATDEPGDVTVTVSSPSLPTVSVTVPSLPCSVPDGITVIDRCEQSPESGEIPLRKIELSTSTRTLTKDAPSVHVSMKSYPTNANCGSIEWTAITRGVAADFVTVDVDENGAGATVTATADGEFALRAYSNIGTPYPAVYSEIHFTAEGVGAHYCDPYRFVPGIVATGSDSMLPEKEGGVRSLASTSSVLFENVDFGPLGSDDVAVTMMRYHNSTLPFSIYDVTEGEEKLGEFYFVADHPWYTYSTRSYKLPHRLCGLRRIRFDFIQPMIFGGFRFAAPARAYEILRAPDCDVLYGDTYRREGDRIAHIGNNVTVGFAALEFGDGASTVTVCGKTHHERDTVEIRIGDEVTAVDFAASDKPYEVTVSVSGAVGTADVNAVFLPGCDFDLYYIRFNK